MKRITVAFAIIISASVLLSSCKTTPKPEAPETETLIASTEPKDELTTLLESGQTEKVRELFKTRVDTNSKNARGETPLHLVVNRGEADLAAFLIAAGSKVDEKDAEGRTALEIACVNRDAKTAAVLSSAGADIFLAGSDDKTPVDYALGSLGLLDAILNKSNIDSQNAQGKTILHLAAERGDMTKIDVILKKGAKPSLRDNNGRTALDAAYSDPSSESHAAAAERLILSGAHSDNKQFAYFAPAVRSSNYNVRFDDGFAPLHFASRENHTGFMQFMISRRADVNAKNSSGAPPLHEAVREGNLDAVKILIEEGAEINARDAKGNSAMHLVMPLESRLAIVKYLIGKGADPNIKDDHGEAPLHVAISLDLGSDFVETLLIDDGISIDRSVVKKIADPNLRNTTGKTPLHTAVERERPVYIPALLSAKADIFATDNSGLTPFVLALGKGLSILDALITRDTVSSSDNMGNTLLHAAVNAKADTRTVNMILEAGGDVKARNKSGDTPLHLAVRYDLKEVGSLLIQQGSDIFTVNSSGESPLYLAAHEASGLREWILNTTTLDARDGLGNGIIHYAAKWKLDSLIASLVERGATADLKNANGETPLFEAVKTNSPSTIAALLAAGAMPSVRDILGNTALHAAVRWNAETAAEALIAGNIDVNARNLSGKTPLHDAVRLGMIDLEKRLIASGADVEARDLNGATVMMESVSSGLSATVERLIDYGANPETRNSRGDTPLHIAVLSGRKDIATLLLSQGVSIHAKNALGQSPFREALASGSIMINALLTKDRVNESDDDGKSPLHIAIEHGVSLENLRAIIAAGARVNDLDSLGRTPLRMAIDAKEYALARALIDAGSDLFASAYDGESPATLALANGSSVLKSLLSETAVKTQDTIGNTVLHYASYRNDAAVVKQLLDIGALKAQKNVAGETAYDLAVRWGKEENAKLLK